MKRLIALTLVLILTAACSRPDETAGRSEPASAPASSATETPAAQRAESTAAATQSQAEASAATGATAEPDANITLAQADLSSVEAAGFVEGKNYLRLSPTQRTSTSPGKVEVDEFFMYSCPHCFDLEPYVEAWLEKKPAYINFVRIPTTWDDYRTLHARAFYTEEALGKTDEMHMPFFQEIHLNGNYLETPDKIADFFAKFGVGKKEFDSTFESFGVNTKLNRAVELGRRYGIDSTPSFIVNGKYRTDVGLAGGTPDKLWQLIEALAAAEQGR